MRRFHRREAKAHLVGVEFQHLFEIKIIGLFIEGNRVFGAALNIANDDARQAVLQVRAHEMARERNAPGNHAALLIGRDIDPIGFARRGQRRLDDLEIVARIGVRQNIKFVAVVIDLILKLWLARLHHFQRRIGFVQVNQQRFRRLVIFNFNRGEITRLGFTDTHEPA